MAEQINALLIHDQDEAFQGLAAILESLNIHSVRANNCREAATLLNHQGFDVVFAGVAMPDGGWPDVLGLARHSTRFLPVIVVSRTVDVGLYLDVLEKGAFDFITPPFLASGLAHIIRSATYKNLAAARQNLSAPRAA